MTTSKPNPKYDVWKDTRPSTVSIGVSLITHEVEHLEQDGQHIEIPLDNEVIYLTAKYEVVYTANGNCDYNKIALLAEEAGWPRSHWKVMSVWTVVPENQHPF